MNEYLGYGVALVVVALVFRLFLSSRNKKGRRRPVSGSTAAEPRHSPAARPAPTAVTENPSVGSPTPVKDPGEVAEVAVETQKEVPAALRRFTLLLPEDIDASVTDNVLQMTTSLHKPHPMLAKLTRGYCEPAELIEIVKSDPEIAAKILRTVNSAQFALSQPITSINHAITFLGVSFVKDITTQFVISSAVRQTNPALQPVYGKIWMSSYVASTGGLMLAQMLGDEQAADISTLALLTCIGDLAILTARPELAVEYLQQPSLFSRANMQQAALQLNSAIVGSALAEQWELPVQVAEGLKSSVLPMAVSPEDYPYDQPGMKKALLCYVACRLGDLVAYRGLTDVSDIDFDTLEGEEFFYLQEHIQRAGLAKMNRILHEPGFVKKMNHFITQVSR